MAPSKVALVTGSGKRRVGWHVADALAGRRYASAIHSRRSAAEATEPVAYSQGRGVQPIALQAALTDEQAVRSLVQQTLDRFGRLDVVVNCAATGKSKRLKDVPAPDVRHY